MKRSRTKRLAAGLLAMVLAFSMVIGIVPAKAATDGSIQVESELADGKVRMTVKAVNLSKVGAVQLDIAYDTASLTYEGYDSALQLESDNASVSASAQNGVVTVAYVDGAAQDAPVAGTVLVVLVFAVKEGVTATTTQVTVDLQELYAEENCQDTTQNRAVAENTAAREAYGDPDVTALAPAGEVEVVINTGTPEPAFKLGDVTKNGKIETSDASMILQYVVGKITLTEQQMAAADVTKNGKIETSDASMILQYLVGKTTISE